MNNFHTAESGGSKFGFLLLLVAIAVALLIWLDIIGTGDPIPSLSRPMVADVTGFDQGDPQQRYPIRVFINPDAAGAIAMNYRGKEIASRFRYATRNSAVEQVSVAFQAQLYGTDQMPSGEHYFLTLNKGGAAVLVWHNRSAEGVWTFAD